ncbi:MAG: [acyl-carrier-protein] S-malonyltransferase [Alphaproteobacteria bacterium CG11_big_fil_rev_8_21_14_0_20_39_49]|nr:MAG: [acyl-carrier-protein] S-malonyltransferase [Alphaproteobacteria bacterium CG11_big_fil_rev_8_21_14_0_20_39_49]
MSKAFVFPGQGSQFVGMGKDFADNFASAKDVFEEVDEALNEKLSAMIFEGTIEDLTMTRNTQPALMATSIAITRTIEKQSGKKLSDMCHYVAGHSLGEYSALCAAGAISLSDTAKLLRIRGNAMTDAVPQGQGSMAALIGTDYEQAAKISKEVSGYGVCQAANDNGGGQVVISGDAKAIDQAIIAAQNYGIKRAVKLAVSAPFHCELMLPAAKIMEDALGIVNLKSPNVPLIANVTADVVIDSEDIKKLLVKQVTGTVRWRESVLKLKEKGINKIVEFGAGKVLSTLVKRIDSDIESSSVQTVEDMEAFLKEI